MADEAADDALPVGWAAQLGLVIPVGAVKHTIQAAFVDVFDGVAGHAEGFPQVHGRGGDSGPAGPFRNEKLVLVPVGDPLGQAFEDIEVTVDTGSNYTAVPRAMLERLRVPVNETVPSRLADGSTVMVELGDMTIRLEEKEFHTPVIFAEEGEPSLLGVVSLEEARLAVDPWQDA